MSDVTASPAALDPRQQGQNLFLVGFLVLFLELACIRWFSATVIFLQFFTNVVLIASFLGMSCGCLAARGRRDWLAYFPLLTLATAVAAILMMTVYLVWSGFAIDVGHQDTAQEVFFGTEYRNPDVAQFVMPIELIMAVFFVLIALMFVGLGQVLGRAFDAYPNRVMGYTLNIAGSLAGIAGFSLISFLQAPPSLWFLVSNAGIGYLLYRERRLTGPRGLALAALVVTVALPGFSRENHGHELRWSPYYAVDRDRLTGAIAVNTISHQQMLPFDSIGGSPYSLIHLLRKHSGGPPFQDMLVIGAGSGNDLDHALRYDVGRIDAVEIDPVIQDIGIRNNPDHPYQDPRVVPHLDDGRHFLRTTERKYDLVVYALVDSLILHSGYANIRLESYLFTEQAFADIKRVLKPEGVFITYNFFRQGWIVARVAAMAEQAFGCKPIVLSLPYRPTLAASARAGFTMVIAGCNRQIAEAFASHPAFWLNPHSLENLGVDGFAIEPDKLPAAERDKWLQITPTTLVQDSDPTIVATDDWPFLYLQGRLVPTLNIRAMVVMGGLGLAMVYLFMPRDSGARRPRLRINGRMFFLGAAFMLLETKAVVQLALLFGSTWLVNSLVFFTVLILILLANLYVLAVPKIHLVRHYLALMLFLAASILIPLQGFLEGGILWRYGVPCLLALGPMFFAGVIFAQSFRQARNPDQAFGSNIAGSVLGGLSESFSMLLGFRYLLLIAMTFYALSAWMPARRAD